jgi:uncharacterized protein (DUF433 family)
VASRKKIIVKTPGTLGGRPRIDGHRIGVIHVWFAYLRALDEIAIPKILNDFPSLTEEEVREALYYAWSHPEEIQEEIKEMEDAEERFPAIPHKKAART